MTSRKNRTAKAPRGSTRQNRTPGSHVTPDTRAISRLGHIEILMDILEKDNEYASDEVGKDVRLYIRSTRSAINLNLTTLTLSELNALAAIFATAFDLARDVCEERDRVALEKGDTDEEGAVVSFWRIHQRVPEVLVRNGEGYEYDPELQLRSSYVADMDSFVSREVHRTTTSAPRSRGLLDGVG